MPTIESELEIQRKAITEDWSFGFAAEDGERCCLIGSRSVLFGRVVTVPECCAEDRARSIVAASVSYPPLLETLHRIKSLCQHSNTPAVNVGAHELAGKILALIQQWEER